ncbi:type II toxin-antitoxin system VapC family toxin [Candidatus Margulisiibacteriota bacterium]
MRIVIDASAIANFALKKNKAASIDNYLSKADFIIAPSLLISEITNVFWKYHTFQNVPINLCESLIDKSINSIDKYYNEKDYFQEAFSFSCLTKHSVYDAMYLILARRENANILTLDKKMQKTAKLQSIKILDL